MNIIKFAEALGIDTTCEKQELDKVRIEYGIGMDTARQMIVEPKIYERIKELVKYELEYKGYGYGYDGAIANLVNNLWGDLTEEEKQQIKEILE